MLALFLMVGLNGQLAEEIKEKKQTWSRRGLLNGVKV